MVIPMQFTEYTPRGREDYGPHRDDTLKEKLFFFSSFFFVLSISTQGDGATLQVAIVLQANSDN